MRAEPAGHRALKSAGYRSHRPVRGAGDRAKEQADAPGGGDTASQYLRREWVHKQLIAR